MKTPRYTVEPGRAIHRDGKPLVYLSRGGVDIKNGHYGTSPTECDKLVHDIVAFLNAREENAQ